MPPCSMVHCPEEGEEGKTALIDQRAVAVGKKSHTQSLLICPINLGNFLETVP